MSLIVSKNPGTRRVRLVWLFMVPMLIGFPLSAHAQQPFEPLLLPHQTDTYNGYEHEHDPAHEHEHRPIPTESAPPRRGGRARPLQPIRGIVSIEYLYAAEGVSTSIGIGYYDFTAFNLGYSRLNLRIGVYSNIYFGLYYPEPFYNNIGEGLFPNDDRLSSIANNYTVNGGWTFRASNFISAYAGLGFVVQRLRSNFFDETRILANDGNYYVDDSQWGGRTPLFFNGNFGIILTANIHSILVGYNTYSGRISVGYGVTF